MTVSNTIMEEFKEHVLSSGVNLFYYFYHLYVPILYFSQFYYSLFMYLKQLLQAWWIQRNKRNKQNMKQCFTKVPKILLLPVAMNKFNISIILSSSVEMQQISMFVLCTSLTSFNNVFKIRKLKILQTFVFDNLYHQDVSFCRNIFDHYCSLYDFSKKSFCFNYVSMLHLEKTLRFLCNLINDQLLPALCPRVFWVLQIPWKPSGFLV